MSNTHFQNGMHVMTGILIPYLAIFYHIMQKLIKGFLKKIFIFKNALLTGRI
jgi:hypothetical protein